jgi:hypothetical protein
LDCRLKRGLILQAQILPEPDDRGRFHHQNRRRRNGRIRSSSAP